VNLNTNVHFFEWVFINGFKEARRSRRQYPYDQWSPWGNWGDCSRTCGGGVTFRERRCYSQRTDGGSSCVGPSKTYRSCNIQDCPEGSRDFREEQCAQFDGTEFQGKRYKWLPYYGAPNKCELNCIPKGENFYYRHREAVTDGTPCEPGKKDICVDGVCKSIGCDNMMESSQKEDKCLECGGDGRRCYIVQGTFDAVDLPKGYNQIFIIPVGATSIHIREVMPTRNFLAIKNVRGEYYLNGHWTIDFSRALHIASTVIHYDRGAEGDLAPELVHGRGPTTEPLVIELIGQEPNRGIAYEYYLPYRPPNQGYFWSYGSWSECSSECGGGYQSRLVFCTIDNEAYPDYLCWDKSRPLQNRTCNIQLCPQTKRISYVYEPRGWIRMGHKITHTLCGSTCWKTGEWGPCSTTCGGGSQSRSVYCVSYDGRGSQGVVDDTECSTFSERPHSQQICSLRQCAAWTVGPWLECSVTCGENGVQTRTVTCSSGLGSSLQDFACPPQLKPPATQACVFQPCVQIISWHIGAWGLVSSITTLVCHAGYSNRRHNLVLEFKLLNHISQSLSLSLLPPCPFMVLLYKKKKLELTEQILTCDFVGGGTSRVKISTKGYIILPPLDFLFLKKKKKKSPLYSTWSIIRWVPGGGLGWGLGVILGQRVMKSSNVKKKKVPSSHLNFFVFKPFAQTKACRNNSWKRSGPNQISRAQIPAKTLDWPPLTLYIPSFCVVFFFPLRNEYLFLAKYYFKKWAEESVVCLDKKNTTQNPADAHPNILFLSSTPLPPPPQKKVIFKTVSNELVTHCQHHSEGAGTKLFECRPDSRSPYYYYYYYYFRLSVDRTDPSLVDARPGQTVKLLCRADASPSLTIEWRKDDKAVSSASFDRHAQHTDGSLVISRVTSEDAGRYICTVSNGHDKDYRLVQLRVQGVIPLSPVLLVWFSQMYCTLSAPKGTAEKGMCISKEHLQLLLGGGGGFTRRAMQPHQTAPHLVAAYIRPSLSVVEARIGQSAQLLCPAEGLPRPEVHWERSGLRLGVAARPRFTQLDDNSLQISPVAPSDVGEYICVVTNNMKMESSWLKLSLEGGNLRITSPPKNVQVSEGENAQLSCVVSGTNVNVRWSRNGVPVRPDGRHVFVSQDGSLILHNTLPSDEGSYTCNAYSGSHSASATAEVKVLKIKPGASLETALPQDPSGECIDQPDLANCDLIVYAQLCSNEYYSSFCCASCSRHSLNARPLW
uniref:Papilin, proteoglycan like sulfated glycoprotein n=1 Tax=Latimeria chalumnae TaxID=7897 RepID=H3ALS1_LATCH